MRTVLRALDAGALLLADDGVGARLGCYLAFGKDRTPIRRDVFDRLRDASYIAPVLSPLQPQRWRATSEGQAALAGQEQRRQERAAQAT